jgi:hypothetical protein
MESLTRLVSESLARHGFDRPVDYRRLRWSQWFRCESHHSLLSVPSKAGVFAFAEEVMAQAPEAGSRDPEADTRRLLAVTQFFDADDMAFVLDRMLSSQNPMRARLISGRYFVRFVVIEDESHRRSISSALNQWIADAGEKASGIGAHFASSLEISDFNVGRTLLSASTAKEASATNAKPTSLSAAAPHLDSGAATNIHCPSPFPSGF